MPKIFISSVVHGLEAERNAAAEAIRASGCTPIRCEDFGAQPVEPKRACEEAVDASDAIVAIFGHRWGFVPLEHNSSKLSATALEVERARLQGKPVLLFLKKGDPKAIEPELHHYLEPLTAFSTGLTFAAFRSPSDLHAAVKASIAGLFHRYLLSALAPSEVTPPPPPFQTTPAVSTQQPSSFTATVTNYGGAVAISQTGNATAIHHGSASPLQAPAASPPHTQDPHTKQLLDDLSQSIRSLMDFVHSLGKVDGQLRDLVIISQGIKAQLDYMWKDMEQAATKADFDNLLKLIGEQAAEQVPNPSSVKAITKDIGTGVLGNGAYDLLTKILLPLLLRIAG